MTQTLNALFSLTLYDIVPSAWAFPLVAVAFVAGRYLKWRYQDTVVYSRAGKKALHDAEFIRELPAYSILYLTGLPIVPLLGVQWLAAVAFQLPLNQSLTGHWLNEGESWDLFGVDVPKPFAGKGRILQIALGTALIAGHFIWGQTL